MRQQLQSQECRTEAGAVCAAAGGPVPAARATKPPLGSESQRDALRHAIETTVIPRLLMAQARLRQEHAPPASLPPPPAEAIAELVELLLARAAPAAGFVEAMRAVGTSPESIYLDLLAPAARRLGVMWEEDECCFTEVTIGLQRLHTILHLLAPDFMGPALKGPAFKGPDLNGYVEPRRALMVQAPGEQHGLGLSMVVQFFRRDGWAVWNEPVATSADLVDRVRHAAVSLIGISVSCNERLDALASDIQAIRKHSKNRGVAIMVGGPIFIEHPQLAAMVGADATAKDGRDAVCKAAKLVSASAARR